jgi:DNA-binding NarL/FixJ family response regulator
MKYDRSVIQLTLSLAGCFPITHLYTSRTVLILLLLCHCGGYLEAAFFIPKIVQQQQQHRHPSKQHRTKHTPRQIGLQSSTNSNTKNQKRSASIIQPFVKTAVNTTEKFLARNPHWILLVDDEEAIRQSVGDFLFEAGYQITACADAESAKEVLRSCTNVKQNYNNSTGVLRTTLPGCALLDIRMPGGPDGIELLQWIRSTSELQRLPVILLTAKGMTVDRIQGYSAGCDFYLSKPFVPEELLSMIDAAVVRKSLNPLEDVLAQVNTIKAQLSLRTQQKVETTSDNGTTPTNYYNDKYLTPSERNVLELLCDGLTNQEISEIRNTTTLTVQRHLKNVYTKSNTKTRTQLVKWALQNGFVPIQKPQ